MPQILVWQCPRTKRIFQSKDDYVAYLKEEAKHNLAQKTFKKNFAECINAFNKLTSIDDLFTSFPELINYYYNKLYGKDIKCKFNIKYNINYNNTCSNSHACPRDGVTNWGGFLTKEPRSYPGLQGRISFHFSNESSYNYFNDLSHLIKSVGVHIGTGGGGPKELSYDVILFKSDWPNISEMYLNDIKSIIE